MATVRPQVKAHRAGRRPTFADHIDELRARLTWSVLALIAASGVGYFFQEAIQKAIVQPLHQELYYTSPGGGFNFLFQACVGFGLVVSLPVFSYHFTRFIEPILSRRARRLIVMAVIGSAILAAIGMAFAYWVALPAALHFLTSFSNQDLKALISIDSYLSFATIYLIGFAVAFQLPLLLLLINMITPLGPGGLMKYSRFVILGSFVIAAIITPTPDPLNQSLFAVPIILLYGLSATLIWIVNLRKKPAFKLAKAPQPASPPALPSVAKSSRPAVTARPLVRPAAPQRHLAAQLDLSHQVLPSEAERIKSRNILNLRKTGA